MAETYSTLAANPKALADWFCRIELWSLPYKLANHGATALPICLTSKIPVNATGYTTTNFIRTLKDVRITPDSVNPTTGATTIGSCSITFSDFRDSNKWWTSAPTDYYFAEVFAGRKASRVGSLAADIDHDDTSASLIGTYTDGTVYWLGSEAILLDTSGTGSVASPLAATLIRGAAGYPSVSGITAVAHPASTATAAHADDIYDRPRIFRGLIMAVYFNFDHADLSYAGEVAHGYYLINAPPTWSVRGDTYEWSIKGDSITKLLRKQFGRGAFAGSVDISTFYPTVGGQQSDQPAIVVKPVDSPDYPLPAFHTASDRTFLQVDDEVVEAEYLSGASGGRVYLGVVARNRLGTRSQSAEPIGVGVKVREVIPSDDTIEQPRTGYIPYDSGYALADLVATAHPIDTLMCLATSRTGDGSNAWQGTGKVSWDTLPKPWGLGIYWGFFNPFSWQTLRSLTSGCRMPHFRLGHDGPEDLMSWWEKECAPLVGIAIVQRPYAGAPLIDGVQFDDAYPLQSSVAVSAQTDFLKPYSGQEGAKADTLGLLQVKYRARDGAPARIDEPSVLINELFPNEVKTRDVDSDGTSDETRAFLLDRLTSVIAREEFSTPRRKVALSWRFHNQVFVGTKLSITDPNAPDVAGGGYGVEAETWLVLSAGLNLPVSGSGGSVVCDIIRVDDGVGHIAPAGVLTAWDAGTKTFTISANQFTPTSAPVGTSIPNSDIQAFGDDGSQGGQGLLLEFWDSTGDVKTTNRLELTTLSYAGNTGTVDAAPSAVPQVGWIVVPAQMVNANKAEVTAGTVSATYDDFLYWSDDARDAQYIDTSVPAYRYGQ